MMPPLLHVCKNNAIVADGPNKNLSNVLNRSINEFDVHRQKGVLT